jgi:hypothetical protein
MFLSLSLSLDSPLRFFCSLAFRERETSSILLRGKHLLKLSSQGNIGDNPKYVVSTSAKENRQLWLFLLEDNKARHSKHVPKASAKENIKGTYERQRAQQLRIYTVFKLLICLLK